MMSHLQTEGAGNDHDHYEAVIIGGGQAGLATAYYLMRAGVQTLILDDQPASGGAWLHVWPSLHLFSTSDFSNLPGWPMPKFDGFPPSSHVVDYLTEYERRYEIPVSRSVSVDKVDFVNGVFHLQSGTRSWIAKNVVSATGTWSAPFVPTFPGKFSGTHWHSSNYPGVHPFVGQRIAIVGGANSGAQIAAELSEVSEVTWFTRDKPRWMPDDIDGRELFRRNRLRALAIQRGERDPGPDSELGDIVMLPEVRRARDSGKLFATPMFGSLDEIRADHLIWCTGFRPAIRPVRQLLKHGQPKVPGLYLVGYGDWTGPGSATITGVGLYAKRAAKEIAASVGKVVK
ncbi:ArsO family NAD(P)H-dependent flavin-containing monooxygenase [Corynebacterium glutamicum]